VPKTVTRQASATSRSARKDADRAFRNAIRAALPSPGQRVPTIEVLARQFRVGRQQVQRALLRLCREGILHAVSPRVRVVAATHSRLHDPASSDLLLLAGGLPPSLVLGTSEVSFPERFVSGIGAALRDHGLNAIWLSRQYEPERIIEGLAEALPRGVLLLDPEMLGRKCLPLLKRLAEAGVPVAAYGEALPEAWLAQVPCDRAESDHRVGARALTELLVTRGRQRILMVSWTHGEEAPVGHWFHERRGGYEEACRAAGIEVLPHAVLPAVGMPTGTDSRSFDLRRRMVGGLLMGWLSGPNAVDAILAASDGHCPVLAAACRLFAREPGKDVMIVGYDNYWRIEADRAHEPAVPLATVDKHDQETGRAMVQLVLDRAAGRLPPDPQVRRIAPELIELSPEAHHEVRPQFVEKVPASDGALA